MEQTITEILEKVHVLQLSQREVLESYSHIDLTDDEICEALIYAKRQKIERMRVEEYKKVQEANRKQREQQWNFDIIKTYMVHRAEKLFKGKFILDEDNECLFDLLCFYFIGDEERFVLHAIKAGVEFPSVKKGLLIPGNYGTGKTWLMQLFSRNARQCFEIIRAKDISQSYLNSKEKEIPEKFLRPFRAYNRDGDIDVSHPSEEIFNQKILGLCIDDLGSEDVKNNFGNKVNVIGDLIESRYTTGFYGPLLHGTTNLSAEQIKAFYGGRVTSRMREIFNFIELPGNDRRK